MSWNVIKLWDKDLLVGSTGSSKSWRQTQIFIWQVYTGKSSKLLFNLYMTSLYKWEQQTGFIYFCISLRSKCYYSQFLFLNNSSILNNFHTLSLNVCFDVGPGVIFDQTEPRLLFLSHHKDGCFLIFLQVVESFELLRRPPCYIWTSIARWL